MEKVVFLNSNSKHIKKCMKFLVNFESQVLSIENIKGKYKIKLDNTNSLYNDYVKLVYIYENGGLLLDGKYEIYSELSNFFLQDVFLGFSDINKISTNIIWAKEKKNTYIKKIIDLMELICFNDITEVFSKAFSRDFKNTNNSLITIENKLYIYPYDYFYPLDYDRSGKDFSQNLTAILYENKKISLKSKIKLKFIKLFGTSGYRYTKFLLRKIKHKIYYKKYIENERKGKYKSEESKIQSIDNACKKINEYVNKKIKYIVIYNPKWLGVTAATNELFENLVPLEEIYTEKDANILSEKITNLGVEQVIFSAFADGWDILSRKLKEKDKNTKLKCFWHGSHSQVIETINWRTNVSVINLHKEGIIDIFATCKESIINFYKSQNYNTHFIKNTVRLDEKLLQEIETERNSIVEDDKVRIGIYAAGMSWRKNMFNQIAAASQIKNAVIDSVPLDFIGQTFASRLNIDMIGSTKGLKREELLKRMSRNDINLYVTFSECAPMLPIESMEVGVICLTGDTNHYFKNTELEKYLIIDREDDTNEIIKKIKYALENKEKILELYRQWKNVYDIESKKSVEEFLKM
ncbi:MAG: glycosyltransferase [Clostridia bacterium]|nr:glycosyltransferase [Clostridia bacterium]